MKPTKRAYNHVITPSGLTIGPAVVDFDDSGRPVAWHPLQGEESFVEWVGGTFAIGTQP